MTGEGPTVLFAGGGSGGHIYPNVAVDAAICEGIGEALGVPVRWTTVPAAPLSVRPGGAWRFVKGLREGSGVVRAVMEGTGARAMLATGGFVSGPAVWAAKGRLDVGLVSLDAVPGKANRLMARWADAVWSAYAGSGLKAKAGGAEVIGLPLRRSVVGAKATGESDDRARTLLVFGGSQGGGTINSGMAALVARTAGKELLAGWRVVHVSGQADREVAADAYAAAEVTAEVLAFSERMGDLWARADLCVCRAGGGSVAEAWANAVPAVFLPYPFHKDQHQRLNAMPLVNAGAAVLMKDEVDAEVNASRLLGLLRELLGNPDRLAGMRKILKERPMPDGAGVVAQWVAERLG